jgi:hypothetical protein
MRYYHAIDDKGNPTIILSGIDANGDDLTGGVLLELGPYCPPWCPSNKELLS